MNPLHIFALCCGALIALFAAFLVFQIVKLLKIERKKIKRQKDISTYTFYEKDENTLTIEL